MQALERAGARRQGRAPRRLELFAPGSSPSSTSRRARTAGPSSRRSRRTTTCCTARKSASCCRSASTSRSRCCRGARWRAVGWRGRARRCWQCAPPRVRRRGRERSMDAPDDPVLDALATLSRATRHPGRAARARLAVDTARSGRRRWSARPQCATSSRRAGRGRSCTCPPRYLRAAGAAPIGRDRIDRPAEDRAQPDRADAGGLC